MKFNTCTTLACAFVAASLSAQAVYAASTPAERERLRIHTGAPKKAGESLFSYTAEWRQDGGKLYHSTGMAFLDAHKSEELTNPVAIAKKLATSMKDGMTQLYPNWRGLNVEQPHEHAALVLSNKTGYALTTVVVRDYTNQTMSFDLVDKSFNTEAVQLAFDLVLAADVEYLDKFSAQKSKTAGHGEIEIKVDGQKPIQIKTDGKTTRDIEAEIVRHLNLAKLSETTLVTSQANKDTRNIKPFDGSEVQLLNLAAKSVAIDVNDPSLGVLVKFKFKEDTADTSTEPSLLFGALSLIGLAAGAYFWRVKRKR